MRWLILLLLLTSAAWAEPEIEVRMEPDGQLRLENPAPEQIDLEVEPPPQQPPAYEIWGGPWWYSDWQEDPAWLYLYGRYPNPVEWPSLYPGWDNYYGPCW